MTRQGAVRPFTDGDYDFLAEMDHAVLGTPPRSAEHYRHSDATKDPSLFLARHVLVVDGQPVGCGEIGHSAWIDDRDTYWLQMLVRPDVDDFAANQFRSY